MYKKNYMNSTFAQASSNNIYKLFLLCLNNKCFEIIDCWHWIQLQYTLHWYYLCIVICILSKLLRYFVMANCFATEFIGFISSLGYRQKLPIPHKNCFRTVMWQHNAIFSASLLFSWPIFFCPLDDCAENIKKMTPYRRKQRAKYN